MTRKWRAFVIAVIVVGCVGLFVANGEYRYAYVPPEDKIESPGDLSPEIDALLDAEGVLYDVWGDTVHGNQLQLFDDETGDVPKLEEGAIRIDQEFLDFGREMFYEETFGNEVFLTDIMGILDGALTLPNIMKAITELGGEGTDNLQVELAETLHVGDQTYEKGTKMDTGLDVPRGAYAPLGMPVSVDKGRVRAGISCAACHATVDRETGNVIEGAPNKNLNAGLLIAAASNSAAYFTNAEMESLAEYLDERINVPTEDGPKPVPNPEQLEQAVDDIFGSWPAGNFDSTIDLVANPTQIPDSFTKEDHPYGWTGFAMVGPFNGLSTLNNNVHSQNSDTLGQMAVSEELFDMNKDVYIATILQRAAHPDFQYDTNSDVRPSAFWEEVDPTPGMEGANENIRPPTFPKLSLYTPNGTVISSPGYRVAEQINAMSAYQNSLAPPKPKNVDEVTANRGRDVFDRAGCVSCHSGSGYTNHRIISVNEIQTEPSRARSFADIEPLMTESYMYRPDTPVPIPEDATVVRIPEDHIEQEQKDLAYAHNGSDGGYKVKGLIGLAWSPPYLHDGGVAVGKDDQHELGLPNTLMNGTDVDAANSLRALIDEELRQKVVEANRQSDALQRVNVDGSGHEYWVDEARGFTAEEQDALIDYLLSLTYGNEDNDTDDEGVDREPEDEGARELESEGEDEHADHEPEGED